MRRIEDEPWYRRTSTVEMKPWVWATLPLRGSPVEVVSHPWREGTEWRVMVRMQVGDPTSIRELPARVLACCDPSCHEDYYRARQYYNDNPTAFIFADREPSR